MEICSFGYLLVLFPTSRKNEDLSNDFFPFFLNAEVKSLITGEAPLPPLVQSLL